MSVPIVNLGNGHVSNLDSLGMNLGNESGLPTIKDDGTIDYTQMFRNDFLTSNTTGSSIGNLDFITLAYLVDVWSLMVKPFVKDGLPMTGEDISGTSTTIWGLT